MAATAVDTVTLRPSRHGSQGGSRAKGGDQVTSCKVRTVHTLLYARVRATPHNAHQFLTRTVKPRLDRLEANAQRH